VASIDPRHTHLAPEHMHRVLSADLTALALSTVAA
jgi:hypothetical protein